jgi:hypothetical protein
MTQYVYHDRDLAVWHVVIGYFAISALAFSQGHFDLRFGEATLLFLPLLVGAATTIIWLTQRPAFRLVRVASTLIQHSLCAVATMMLAFSAARLNRPLVDAELLRFDQALGYDWKTVTGFVAAMPWLEGTLNFAYSSLFWQPVIVAITLSADENPIHLNRYVLAHVLLMALTIAIFALWPAMTAWTHLGIPKAVIHSHHLERTMGWTAALDTLRQGDQFKVLPSSNFAIVGFPSYHCAAAFLNSFAFLRNPRLRGPALFLNATMVAATPIMGGHYIADIACALAVTSLAICAAENLLPNKPSLTDRESPDCSRLALA